ncbi:ltnD, partial [Mucuna pruriens]
MASRKVIGFVGLDELSLEMASKAIHHGYDVHAFEINDSIIEELMKLGGVRCSSPSEAGRDVTALVVQISHRDQTNDLIFGDEGALKDLKSDTVIILRSTILPSFLQKLEKDLAEIYEIAHVVDAYVSYGRSNALNGKVTIASSGSVDAIARARPVLSAMCEKLFTFEGEIGGGSKVKMVSVMLEGINFINSVEALSLGAKAGIHPWIIYDIISNASGNSWYEIILNMAKSLTFPLPVLAATHLQLIHGVSLAGRGDDVTALIKVWEKVYGVKIADAANADAYNPEQLASEFTTDSKSGRRVGFIGLGAMGFGMATHLLSSKFCVVGYDVYKPTLTRFTNAGGLIGNSPAEVSKDADVIIIMVVNEAQAENVLYGEYGAISDEGKNLKLVDAPVSGGVKRASMGTLTIMASGTDDALRSAGLVLAALSEKLYIIKGGCGSGSGIKMINQLLAGVHIASAAEAMAFAARAFEDRVPHMIDNDYTPCSALDIFVKDMGIVTRESSSWKVPLHLSTIAHQLYLAGSAAGWGRIDDAGVVKVYEMLTGVRVEGKLQAQKKDIVLHSLPPEWPQDHVLDIQTLKEGNSKILVVLDDDPTGTQTVHDIEVLTEWTTESLIEQFRKSPKCFFILTNSRSLSSEKASALIKEICTNLDTAAKSVDNIDYTVVLRGDSTLRGCCVQEADAVVSVLGEMDAWIICPFFLQGGRYTIEDIHYVNDSDTLVPAGDTEFAKDAAFGYKSSNLRDWVEEKTNGRILASSVVSISIQLLRKGGPDAVCQHLCSLQK